MNIRNGLKLKSVIFFMFTANCPNILFSQIRNVHSNDSFAVAKYPRRSLFGFSISPYMVDKADATPLSGAYRPKTLYEHGFEVGAEYNIHINNSYSVIVGLHGGAAATNYKLFIPGSDFNPDIGYNWNDYGVPEWAYYMSVPVWIQKRWFTGRNSFWNVVAGINIRYYPLRYSQYGFGEVATDVNGNEITVFEIDATMGNNLRPWLNYNLGGGYSLRLRNDNYLQGNLVVNFSDKKIIDGIYQINVTGKPQSNGTFSANMSYIGLSFSYTSTGAKRRLRKMYEKKMKASN
jgi:hypothetical protein